MIAKVLTAPLIRPDNCLSCAAKHHAAPNVVECRLNPPTVTPIIGPDQGGNPRLLGNVTLFPQVNANMCCKQFKRSIVLADDRLSGVQVEGAA